MLYQLQGPGHHTCTRSLESRVPAKFNLITSLTFGMLLEENKKFRLSTPKTDVTLFTKIPTWILNLKNPC